MLQWELDCSFPFEGLSVNSKILFLYYLLRLALGIQERSGLMSALEAAGLSCGNSANQLSSGVEPESDADAMDLSSLSTRSTE